MIESLMPASSSAAFSFLLLLPSLLRRHAPDFMLFAEPEVAEALGWSRRLWVGKGWRYEVWSGEDPVRLRNVRFLGAARRAQTVDEAAFVKVAEAAEPGMTLAQLGPAGAVDHPAARAAVLDLLWAGRWSVDLTKPLAPTSVLQAA